MLRHDGETEETDPVEQSVYKVISRKALLFGEMMKKF